MSQKVENDYLAGLRCCDISDNDDDVLRSICEGAMSASLQDRLMDFLTHLIVNWCPPLKFMITRLRLFLRVQRIVPLFWIAVEHVVSGAR